MMHDVRGHWMEVFDVETIVTEVDEELGIYIVSNSFVHSRYVSRDEKVVNTKAVRSCGWTSFGVHVLYDCR
jgi:hypothetical protein